MDIKFGICEWSFPQYGPYVCQLAAELGFEGIQLEMSGHERGFPLSMDAIQRGYLEVQQKTGIAYPAIVMRETDWVSMLRPESSKERRIIDTGIRKAIDAAVRFKSEIVMIPMFLESEVKTPADMEIAAACFQAACDRAAEKGVVICAENVFAADQMEEFAAKIDRPNLKLFFDSQNYYLAKGYNTAELLETLFPMVQGIHVKDGRNGNLSGALLGDGDTGFLDTIAVLKKHDYSGWVVLENYYDRAPLRSPDQDPADLIKQDLVRLKEALLE